MAIIGVMASIAVPRYANFIARGRADAAARRVVADLAYAQRLARQSGAAQRVSFSKDLDRYLLVGVPDPDHAGQDYGVVLSVDPYQARIYFVDFGGGLEVLFDGYGVPDNGGAVVVKVGDHVRQIDVDPHTGRASTCDVEIGTGGEIIIKDPLEGKPPVEEL
jgi:type II secretory pathway pseudopilin PulG